MRQLANLMCLTMTTAAASSRQAVHKSSIHAAWGTQVCGSGMQKRNTTQRYASSDSRQANSSNIGEFFYTAYTGRVRLQRALEDFHAQFRSTTTGVALDLRSTLKPRQQL